MPLKSYCPVKKALKKTSHSIKSGPDPRRLWCVGEFTCGSYFASHLCLRKWMDNRHIWIHFLQNCLLKTKLIYCVLMLICRCIICGKLWYWQKRVCFLSAVSKRIMIIRSKMYFWMMFGCVTPVSKNVCNQMHRFFFYFAYFSFKCWFI